MYDDQTFRCPDQVSLAHDTRVRARTGDRDGLIRAVGARVLPFPNQFGMGKLGGWLA